MDLGLPVDHDRVQRLGHCVGTEVVPPVRSWAIEAIDRVAHESRATPVMGMLAALAMLLHMHTGRDELSIGVVTANRDLPEKQALIGYLAGVLPVRVDVSGDPTFRELIRRVRRVMFQQYEAGTTMSDGLPARRDDARTSDGPVCSVLLNYIPGEFVAGEACHVSGVSVVPYLPEKSCVTFDGVTLWQYGYLDFSMLPLANGTGLYGRLGFNRAALERSFVVRLGRDFSRLLRALALWPDRSMHSHSRMVRKLGIRHPAALLAWPAPDSGFLSARPTRPGGPTLESGARPPMP
jgi:hypothetical protein